MDDTRRQQSNEQYEDVLLSMLMDDYAESDGQMLLQEFEKAQDNGELEEIPPELELKCRELINKTFAEQNRMIRLKRIGTSLARVAVIALVIVGLTTVTVLSVDAFRIPVLNFLMDHTGKYSSLVFDSSAEAQTTDLNRTAERFVSNLPEGFTVLSSTFATTSGTIYSKNDDGHIIYLDITTTDRDVNIDTEDVSYTDLDFGSYTAAFREKNGYHLKWIDEQTNAVYTLYSSGLDINDFWKFAYSIID